MNATCYWGLLNDRVARMSEYGIIASWETWWKMGVTQSCDDMGHCYINIATRKPSSVFMEKAARFYRGLKRNLAKKHPFSSNTMHKKSRQKMG